MTTLLYLVGLGVVAVVAWFVAEPLLVVAAEAAPHLPGVDPERHRLEKEKELAYAAIKEAEFDREMGKLSDEDYGLLRAKYEARALAALEALERGA